MSRASALRLLVVIAALPSFGCWEQWSVEWWPQMKWQIAVQAFHETGEPSAPGGFVPPEGTVPIGAVARTEGLPATETDALPNPVPHSLASLDNGKKQFETFCSPCHGIGGLGDGPVAGPPFGKGPFLGVLPLAGPVGSQITKNFSDGHIYTVISQGIRRMPAYRRIPAQQRWDIVNYVRYMNGQLPGAQTAQAAPAAAAAAAQPGGANQ